MMMRKKVMHHLGKLKQVFRYYCVNFQCYAVCFTHAAFPRSFELMKYYNDFFELPLLLKYWWIPCH